MHRLRCLEPGLGCILSTRKNGGPWSSQERTTHIYCLELITATLALKTFANNKTGLSVLMRIDKKTTAVAYINNQGGTVSEELVQLTRDLLMWCLERNIHIHAQHLPGNVNIVADRELRSIRDRSD